MKKQWMACAAAAWLILGCSLFQPKIASSIRAPALPPTKSRTGVPDRGLAGAWRVEFSWGCGSFSVAGWILRADGTFYSPEADGGGTWDLKGSVFRLMFDYNPHTVYTGTVDTLRDSMEGTMASEDGKTGCWRANRDIPTPTDRPTRTPVPR